MQGPEGRPPNVSPARKGWEIDPEEDASAVGAALNRSSALPVSSRGKPKDLQFRGNVESRPPQTCHLDRGSAVERSAVFFPLSSSASVTTLLTEFSLPNYGLWFWTGAPCSPQRTWAENDFFQCFHCMHQGACSWPPVVRPSSRSIGTGYALCSKLNAQSKRRQAGRTAKAVHRAGVAPI
jgi:hypothetical protein